VKLVSHRGIGTNLSDNSLEAFDAAVRAGASVLEVDLRTTSNGEIVLVHNKRHPKIADEGLVIHETTFERLRDAARASGASLATFPAFHRAFGDHELILDIKWRSGPATLSALRAWASAEGALARLQERAFFLVWLPEHAALARALFPRARMVANRADSLRCVAAAAVRPVPFERHGFALVSVPSAVFRAPGLARRVAENLRDPRTELMNYLPGSAASVECSRRLGVDLVMTDHAELWPRISGMDSAAPPPAAASKGHRPSHDANPRQ